LVISDTDKLSIPLELTNSISVLTLAIMRDEINISVIEKQYTNVVIRDMISVEIKNTIDPKIVFSKV